MKRIGPSAYEHSWQRPGARVYAHVWLHQEMWTVQLWFDRGNTDAGFVKDGSRRFNCITYISALKQCERIAREYLK